MVVAAKSKSYVYLWRLRHLNAYAKELNDKAAVEQQMWWAIGGTRPMPDKEKLREWALKLGVPSHLRRKD